MKNVGVRFNKKSFTFEVFSVLIIHSCMGLSFISKIFSIEKQYHGNFAFYYLSLKCSAEEIFLVLKLFHMREGKSIIFAQHRDTQ